MLPPGSSSDSLPPGGTEVPQKPLRGRGANAAYRSETERLEASQSNM